MHSEDEALLGGDQLNSLITKKVKVTHSDLIKSFFSSYFLNKTLRRIMHSMQYLAVNEINRFPNEI